MLSEQIVFCDIDKSNSAQLNSAPEEHNLNTWVNPPEPLFHEGSKKKRFSGRSPGFPGTVAFPSCF
jgi:hypothetical protein